MVKLFITIIRKFSENCSAAQARETIAPHVNSDVLILAWADKSLYQL
jgi:hypothetical protein